MNSHFSSENCMSAGVLGSSMLISAFARGYSRALSVICDRWSNLRFRLYSILSTLNLLSSILFWCSQSMTRCYTMFSCIPVILSRLAARGSNLFSPVVVPVRLPVLAITLGALDASATPLLLVRRCNDDCRS